VGCAGTEKERQAKRDAKSETARQGWTEIGKDRNQERPRERVKERET
jgi:hypothetical protein